MIVVRNKYQEVLRIFILICIPKFWNEARVNENPIIEEQIRIIL